GQAASRGILPAHGNTRQPCRTYQSAACWASIIDQGPRMRRSARWSALRDRDVNIRDHALEPLVLEALRSPAQRGGPISPVSGDEPTRLAPLPAMFQQVQQAGARGEVLIALAHRDREDSIAESIARRLHDSSRGRTKAFSMMRRTSSGAKRILLPIRRCGIFRCRAQSL